jgi:hypothetical protein
MKRKYAILILVLPILAAVALLFWSLGLPLIACLSGHSTSLISYLHYFGFAHVCIFMFGIPAIAWIPSALAGFAVGAWLLLSAQSHKRGWVGITIGIVLALLPIVLLSLAPAFCYYRGP